MINTEKEIKVTKIYLVENCYGNKNKVYIGKEKSHQVTSREGKHKKTYGQQIMFDYIDEVNSLKYEDWEPLETFWINYFKFLGFDVLNKRKKGGSGPEFQTEETKKIMSKLALGKKKTKEHCKNLSKAKKGKPSPFMGYKHNDESKEKIRKTKLGKKFSEETKQKLRKPKTEEHCRNISKGKKGIPKPKGFGEKLKISLCKPILQFNLQGEFIRECLPYNI